jgi:hypothetical protein
VYNSTLILFAILFALAANSVNLYYGYEKRKGMVESRKGGSLSKWEKMQYNKERGKGIFMGI